MKPLSLENNEDTGFFHKYNGLIEENKASQAVVEILKYLRVKVRE